MPDPPVRPGPIVEEVRFAVVMYGGISLCVYMNGIMQQLLHLVRSTARDPARNLDRSDEGDFMLADGELTPIEAVYRRLALLRTRETQGESVDEVKCRFVVDVLSGTSAGGLNNLFLARALANEESVDALTRLWIEEGDIALLLNDRASEDRSVGLTAQDPPRSLLNSDRMAQRLLEAMRTMEASRNGEKGRKSRLVRRLDLYMTATDLKGLDQSLHIGSDERITELRHRAVFHFVHDPQDVGFFPGQIDSDVPRNDFVPEMTPFLTFVARATSSIVPAFEPVRLDDIANLRDPAKDASLHYRRERSTQTYSPFFRVFWRNAQTMEASDERDRRSTMRALKEDFAFRAFGDGGYGDNYPFGYAIDEVNRRPGDYRVDRKFLYVEPDPDLPSLDAAGDGKGLRPNAVQHVAAMFSVKTTETIREDIDRLRERNYLLDRLASIQTAADAGAATKVDLSAERTYVRLRATETTDELSNVFAAALGFEEGTPYAEGVRAIVKAIRVKVFQNGAPDDDKGLVRFVDAFDLAVMRRWLRFVRQRAAEREQRPFEGYLKVRDALRRLSEVVRASAERQTEQGVVDEGDPNLMRNRAYVAQNTDGDREEAILAFLASLNDLGPLRDPSRPGLGRHISLRDLAGLVVAHPIRARTFGYKPGEAPDADRVEAAWRLIVGVPPQQVGESCRHYDRRARATARRRRRAIQKLVRSLEAVYRPVLDEADAELSKVSGAGGADCTWDEFVAVDRVMFPVLYGSGDAESSRIDVLRVSPLDCRTLVDDPKEAKRKLAGTGLGHFSGFFRDVWRAEDILWGRLDGAERLVCAVLSEDAFARRVLILEAQVAILGQTDLDEIVDNLRRTRGQDAVPVESRIETLRAKLLGIALDRFMEWAEEAREIGRDGKLVRVKENRENLGFLALPSIAARRAALLKLVLEKSLI